MPCIHLQWSQSDLFFFYWVALGQPCGVLRKRRHRPGRPSDLGPQLGTAQPTDPTEISVEAALCQMLFSSLTLALALSGTRTEVSGALVWGRILASAVPADSGTSPPLLLLRTVCHWSDDSYFLFPWGKFSSEKRLSPSNKKTPGPSPRSVPPCDAGLGLD